MRLFILGLVSAMLAAVPCAEGHEHFKVSHEALEVHPISENGFYAHTVKNDAVHVVYAAKTKPGHVSLLHTDGLNGMSCEGDSTLLLHFDTDSAAASFLASALGPGSLVSGACAASVPVYGRVIGSVLRPTGEGHGVVVVLEIERVRMRDMFESVRAEVSIAARRTGRSASASRSLRAADSAAGSCKTSGDCGPGQKCYRGGSKNAVCVEESTLGSGNPSSCETSADCDAGFRCDTEKAVCGRETVLGSGDGGSHLENGLPPLVPGTSTASPLSAPTAVKDQFKTWEDDKTRREVSGKSVSKDWTFGDVFAFNYDKVTGSAAQETLPLGGLEWASCKNCYVHIGDAKIHVALTFGSGLDGPEHFGAWISGKLKANLQAAVESPAVPAAISGKEPFTMIPDVQVGDFAFSIGPVPVRFTVNVELQSTLSLAKPIPKGSLGIRGGFAADMAVKAGVEWKDDGGWRPVKDFDYNLKAYPPAIKLPDFTEANSIAVELMPKISLRLYDTIPIVITPVTTIGYDFGGSTNGCAANDAYSQFTELDLGLGVGDIKFPKDGPTLIGGFGMDVPIYGKTPTKDHLLFGPLVCGNSEPNLCTGCLSQVFGASKTKELFVATCKNYKGGCSTPEVKAAARMMGMSASDVDEIQSGGYSSSHTTAVIVAVVCSVCAVALVGIGALLYRRARTNRGPTASTIQLDHLRKPFVVKQDLPQA